MTYTKLHTRILRRLAIVGVLGFALSQSPLPLDGDAGLSEARAQDKGDEKSAKKEGEEAPKSDEKAVAIAEKMQKFYDKTRDYQATFKQVYRDIAAGTKKKSFGRVYFKTPGKMRWDYYKRVKTEEGKKKFEQKKVLVSDGNAFWIYEIKFQQVFKRCLADSQLPTSLRFLLGQGDLVRDFHITLAESSTEKRPVLRLIPKKDAEKSKYKELRFAVDPETYQVVETTIYDPYGNTNKISFSKVLVNKNLPDKGFQFEPPKSARVLNPQKECSAPMLSSKEEKGADKKEGDK